MGSRTVASHRFLLLPVSTLPVYQKPVLWGVWAGGGPPVWGYTRRKTEFGTVSEFFPEGGLLKAPLLQ
jgi:hypothetical protein